VLYKSHQYDPQLLNLCASSLVLLSHSGCIEATVQSAVNARFVSPAENSVVAFLQGMFHELFLWRQHAAVDISSSELKAQPLHSAARVHHAVAAALDVPYQSVDFAGVRGELTRESNPSIPHAEASGEETRAKLRAVMQAAKRRLEYDTRVIGWTWMC
jgi:hypothetical protein